MKSYNRSALKVLLFITMFFSSLVEATTLTFDDVPNVPANSWAYFSGYSTAWNSYDGEGWSITSGDNLTHAVLDTVGSDYEYDSISGEHILFSPAGSYPWGSYPVITAADGSDFTFGGVWARALEGSRNFSIEGYKDDVMVWSDFSLTLNTDWSYYSGSSILFDTLILNFGGDYAVDDLALNETVVPVPAAVWLFGSGLIGLVGVARRKKV